MPRDLLENEFYKYLLLKIIDLFGVINHLKILLQKWASRFPQALKISITSRNNRFKNKTINLIAI